MQEIGERPVVLVVDDDAANRRALSRILEREGYAILSVGSGESALEAVETQQLDAILLDLVMPGMDGIEVLRRFRESPRARMVPTIVMTGLDDNETRIHALHLGAQDYLVRPVERVELVARLANHIRMKRASDDVRARATALSKLVSERTSQLAQGDARYRALIETLPLYVMLISADGRIELVNHAPPGHETTNVVGANLFELLEPENATVTRDIIDRLRSEGGLITYRTAHRGASNGNKNVVRYMENYARLVDEGGGTSRVLFVSLDRTDRVISRLELEGREQRMSRQNAALRRLSRQSPTSDAAFSESFEELLFEVRSALACDSVVGSFWSDRAATPTVTARADSGKNEEGAHIQIPLTAMRDVLATLDGPTAIALRKDVPAPWKGPVLAAPIILDGRLVGALVAESDADERVWLNDEEAFLHAVANIITLMWTGVERHVAIEQLRASASRLERLVAEGSASLRGQVNAAAAAIAKFHAILDAVTDALLVVDRDGYITHANPAAEKFLESDDGALVGSALIDVVQDDIFAEALLNPAGATDPRAPRRLLLGELEFEVSATAAMLDDEDKCTVIVFHDVTEQRALERLKDELLATVNHELRTPLTSLRGFAELLHDRDMPREQQKQFLKIILTETDRLTGLINDFLDIQKIEAGLMVYDRQPVLDLRGYLDGALMIFRPKDAERHPVTLDVADDVGIIEIDGDRIRQVLANLLSNATKFSPEGGEIILKAEREGELVRVSVRDHGMGIPPDAISKLFKKFSRVDNSMTRSIGGSGLGLSLIREIVLAHGGDVSVSSVVGEGSTFSFTIPVVVTKAAA